MQWSMALNAVAFGGDDRLSAAEWARARDQRSQLLIPQVSIPKFDVDIGNTSANTIGFHGEGARFNSDQVPLNLWRMPAPVPRRAAEVFGLTGDARACQTCSSASKAPAEREHGRLTVADVLSGSENGE